MRLRKILLVTFMALAVPVGAASLAYACTALATLTVTSGSGAPGQTITGTGKGFNGGSHGVDPATAARVPVQLRWNSRTGPVMAEALPQDAAGNISFSFQAPNVAAGQYVLIGVQIDSVSDVRPDGTIREATGNPFYGTPARQSVTISAPASRTSASRGEGATATAPATASGPQATAAPGSAAGQPAGADAATATAQPALAAGAPGQAVASPATPLAASQVPTSGAAPAGAATGMPAAASDEGLTTSTALAAAASAESAPVTTATPGLIAASSPDGGSVVPALLLMLVGLGIGLTASARWITGRLPELRDRSRTAAV